VAPGQLAPVGHYLSLVSAGRWPLTLHQRVSLPGIASYGVLVSRRDNSNLAPSLESVGGNEQGKKLL
jgi:hypothetical protein